MQTPSGQVRSGNRSRIHTGGVKGSLELLWHVSKQSADFRWSTARWVPHDSRARHRGTTAFSSIRRPNGDRRFLPGGRTSPGTFVLGQLEHAPVVLVCEGAATAMSLHRATGYPVAAALSAGNLLRASTAIRGCIARRAAANLRRRRPPGHRGGHIRGSPLPQAPSADFNDLHVAERLMRLRCMQITDALRNID